MSILWKNNATSALASDITAGSLSITVTTGHGDRFPEVVAPHYCMVTLVDTSGNREIVKVTSRASASNTMVIERAQEGTSARAFDEGSIVELRITKNAMDEVSKASDINAQHYVCDASAADQGATANSNSLKSIVDALGATEEATIELPHTGTGDTTTYTVGTDLTIPDTVRLIPHKGVRISPSTGVTLTANFEAGAYQIFAGDGTVTVNSYPQDQAWWGSTQRMDMKGLDVTALSIGTKTLALDANTTVSSFAATVLDDADATTARITLGMNQNVYPEDYGAIGDGVTDDSSAIQACFDAVQAMTYRPKIVFKSAKYHIHTGLTIPYAQGMWLAGTGGFYTPQAAGYTDKVTTLDYSGNGVALTIGDGSQNATGLVIEKIYVKGTAAGGAGIKCNTTGGIVLKDCTLGQFSGNGCSGLWILKTQVCSFINCAFIENNMGCYHEGNASENTTLRYHDCIWHSNTIGLREECGVQTTIVNPVFQSQAGSAISVDCSGGPWLSNNLIIHGGYFSGNNESVAGMTIEIRGDSTSGNTYHQGLHISNIYFGSPGAAQTAFIWLRYTTGAVFERLRFASITDDVIIAHPSYNDSLELRDWPYGATYVKEAVGGGTVNWMKTTFSDNYTKLFQGGSVKIHQENSGGAAPALLIQQDDQDFAFVDFIGTSEASSNKNISTWTNATINGFIRVKINGASRWIPYYTAPTS